MSDLVVYKIKGKFFQNELIIQIKGNKKKNSPRNTILKEPILL